MLSDAGWLLTWLGAVLVFAVVFDLVVAGTRRAWTYIQRRRRSRMRAAFEALPYSDKVKQFNLQKLNNEGLALWLSAAEVPTRERQRIVNLVSILKGEKINQH